MSITVNTNMQALKIQQNLNSATSKMNTAMERMSSGSRINTASDDAAGYAVSTKLTTTISSSKVASDNVKIASNLLDTAAGSLDTISSNLSRIRDLTEEASNGTYSSDDLKAIATEVNQRVSEIDRSATAAKFNDISLFDSNGAGKTGVAIQVGTQASDTLTLDSSIFKNATVSTLGLFNVNSGTGNLQVMKADNSGYEDIYLKGASAAVKATDTDSVSKAVTAIFTGTAYTSATQDSTTQYGVSSFLNSVDAALNNVTSRTTSIGASENRLSSISDTLTTQQTNLTAANSTIKDADVAEESASYVQSQILQSASATLLTQANSAPQIALTLIKG